MIHFTVFFKPNIKNLLLYHNMSDQDEKFISFIHNYCDRWCEKCTFTARCRVFAAEQEYTDEEKDIENEAYWRKLAANFAEAKQMLVEKAEEFNIDLDAVSDEEFEEIQKRERDFIDNDELSKLAEKYWKSARKLLEENKEDWLIFAPHNEKTQAEMLEIIYWYLFFISAKIQHGLHGHLDFDETYDEEQLNDPQSDANGSIKIALIAIERSIMAWTNLLAKENSANISPLISLLKEIQQKCEKKFPNARDFIRPGFDEIDEFIM